MFQQDIYWLRIATDKNAGDRFRSGSIRVAIDVSVNSFILISDCIDPMLCTAAFNIVHHDQGDCFGLRGCMASPRREQLPNARPSNLDLSRRNRLAIRRTTVRRLPIESPHDKFFRFAFKHVDLACDLIQWTFPASPLIVSLSMHVSTPK